MEELLQAGGILARVAVGVVLIVAGVMKLRSRTWPVLALEMGAPRAVVILLPAFEAVVGLALVVQVGRPVPAVLAVVLFIAFTIVVFGRVASGNKAPCNCFGGNEEAALGWITVARNVALLGLSVLAMF